MVIEPLQNLCSININIIAKSLKIEKLAFFWFIIIILFIYHLCKDLIQVLLAGCNTLHIDAIWKLFYSKLWYRLPITFFVNSFIMPLTRNLHHDKKAKLGLHYLIENCNYMLHYLLISSLTLIYLWSADLLYTFLPEINNNANDIVDVECIFVMDLIIW